MTQSLHAALLAGSLFAVAVFQAGCASGSIEPAKGLSQTELQERLEQLERRVQRRPTDEEALYQLGNAYFDLGQYREARLAYQSVTNLNPERADAWCNLGLAHRHLGNFINALNAYEQALKVKPDDQVTLRNMATLLQMLGDVAGSARALDRLVALRPEDLGLKAELAQTLVMLERYAEAMPLLADLRAKQPAVFEHAYTLGLAYYYAGRYGQAVREWEAARDLNPDEPVLLQGLAIAYLRSGDPEAAQRLVEECRERGVPLDEAFLEELRRAG